MLLSDMIESIINDMLKENEGSAEFKRGDIAVKFGCVPSQINYVITSRFTPEKGYIVESRRGGGGFIKIRQIQFDKTSYVMHFVNAVGDYIDYETTKVFLSNLHSHGIITEREMRMISNITSDNILKQAAPPGARAVLRSAILKNAVLALIE
ncbi:MAG: CtsR family transcriptional regulator [Oscillospiraceae bacterium]|nr:CtsR family transcriptional regulator [Oscillospiraceae bacterium]